MPEGDAGRSTLEAPEAEELLYHSRGSEVVPTRPILTGDVFSDVEIPGIDDDAALAIVLTHPCAMRKDGVRLADRIFVARVGPHHTVPLHKWGTSEFKVMPLPELLPGEVPHAARFSDAGMVQSNALRLDARLACLSQSGINLLQQRLIWHLTRFAAPTFRLHEACIGVFREVELHDEWAEELVEAGHRQEDVDEEFHNWIRDAPEGGSPRQIRLLDDQQVVAVRREMRSALEERLAELTSDG